MKYIIYWEFEANNFDICAKKYANLPEEMGGKSFSENFVFLGETRGFQLIETENPIDITKLAFYYAPEADLSVQPIIEATQVMDAYKQLKP